MCCAGFPLNFAGRPNSSTNPEQQRNPISISAFNFELKLPLERF